MKCVVSLSGGRDSATCLGLAVEKYGKENVYTIGFEYGSKHPQEIEAAKKIAEYFGVPYQLITIDPTIFKGSTSSLLVQSGKEIELGKTYTEIMEENGERKVDTYVPARNTLFGAYVLAKAESLSQQFNGEEVVIMLGQHADDSGFHMDENGEQILDSSKAAYPDCTLEYVNAFSEVAKISSVGKVKYEAPFVKMHKWELIKIGMNLKKPVPYDMCMSCYQPIQDENGEWKECGICATCLDSIEAEVKAGLRKENK